MMEYDTGGRTGGQYFQSRLHLFLAKRFAPVVPARREALQPHLRNPIAYARYALAKVNKLDPRLIVVDVYSGCRNVLPVMVMKNKRKPVMVIFQGERMTFRMRNLFLVRWIVGCCQDYLLRNADIVVVNSQFLASRAARNVPKGTPIVIARPGMRIEAPVADGQERTGGPTGSPIHVLYVGEANKVKGTEFLVRAMAFLKGSDVTLDLVGDYNPKNPYFRRLQSIIRSNRLGGIVKFLGFVSPRKLASIYSRSSIFVMPSLSEGYGIALAEAISFGLPIVATNVGAIPELVEDGVNGILVPPKDPVALAQAIRKLATDMSLREKMRKANLEKAKSLPTWDDFERVLDEQLVPAIERLTGMKSRKPELETDN